MNFRREGRWPDITTLSVGNRLSTTDHMTESHTSTFSARNLLTVSLTSLNANILLYIEFALLAALQPE
jgi:hypothetical protein